MLPRSACGLAELPEEFCFQTKLIELNLSVNQLRVLPVSFGRLTRLATLNVSDNQLVDLPMSMGAPDSDRSCSLGARFLHGYLQHSDRRQPHPLAGDASQVQVWS
jgi:hypothetical protein